MSDRMLEIVVPATSDDLVSLNEVKGYLGVTGNAQDPWLVQQISAVTQAVEGYLRRTLRPETVEETFWNVKSTLVLSRWPIVSVVSVTEAGQALTAGTDFRAEVRTGMLFRFSSGERCDWAPNTVVRYSAGYVAVPALVKEACYLAVKAAQEGLEREAGVKSERLEGAASMSYFGPDGSGLPQEARDKLQPFTQGVLV